MAEKKKPAGTPAATPAVEGQGAVASPVPPKARRGRPPGRRAAIPAKAEAASAEALAAPADSDESVKLDAAIAAPEPVAAEDAGSVATEAAPVLPAAEALIEQEPAAEPEAAPAPAEAAAPKPKRAVRAKPVVKTRPRPIEPAPKIALAPKPGPKLPKKVKPVITAKGPTAVPPAPAAAPAEPAFAAFFANFMLEDKTMDMNSNIAGLQDAMAEVQAKAKAAFEKGTSVLGEVSEFAKGNVEAVMESGKILAAGMQGLGSEIVSEGRSSFETLTGDIKELAAAKSPTDFFKIQGEMMRKNFDSAVAYGSKNSETMLKLVSDAMAPISGRVSIAMEKARTVSI